MLGDQVFVNPYVLANTGFARQGPLKGSEFTRYTAEIMAVESVHSALALRLTLRLPASRLAT